MNKDERIFQVHYKHKVYEVIGDPWITIEMVWQSIKCWYMPGAVVAITDDKGNKITFIHE